MVLHGVLSEPAFIHHVLYHGWVQPAIGERRRTAFPDNVAFNGRFKKRVLVMAIARLEYDVRERFGLPLDEFLKQKVKGDTLYDHEIAPLLNVSTSSVRKLRHAFGIERANAFSRRFEKTYGEGALERFKSMVQNPSNSLADVARSFSFSREYARQVYKKIYGTPYSNVLQSKRRARKNRRIADKWKKSKQAETLKEVMAKIQSLGMIARISNKGREYMIFVNQYKLILRTTSKPVTLHGNEYFRINIKNCVDTDCDFFICICRDKGKDTYFIIPSQVMPNSVVSLLPDATSDRSKYARFREAWHLIADRSQAH